MTRALPIFTLLALTVCLPAADLPRYNLPVGRVLEYSGETHEKSLDDASENVSSAKTRVIVLAENPDGSKHIVLRSEMSYGAGEDRTELAFVDIQPDGKVILNPTIQMGFRYIQIFPPLPADQGQLKTRWQDVRPLDSTTTSYAVKSDPSADFVFTSQSDGPIDHIYGMTNQSTLHFDRAKGVIVLADSELSQNFGFHSKGTGTLKLNSDQTLPADEVARLKKDYDVYFAAKLKSQDLFSSIENAPEQAEKALAAAKEVLVQGAANVSADEVKAEFNREIQELDEWAPSELNDAKQEMDQLNKPAKDWSAQDLDGKDWTLSQLKGKVVVMDFWYRACGWCMYATPQIKQLATDYKDKPVIFLGMNTDQDEENAKFVVKEFSLQYPQIKAIEIPKLFGVNGFPTLIIVDQQGMVRAFHTGYSPDLHDSVAKIIDALLKPAGT